LNFAVDLFASAIFTNTLWQPGCG